MTYSEKIDKDEWLSIEGPFTNKDLMALRDHGRIERLAVTKQKVISVAIAKGFSALQSVRWLWLWCPITRAAMRYVMTIPDLETLDILELRSPGHLTNFDSAGSLKAFRGYYMSEEDLLEVSTLLSLEELCAQNSIISHRVLDALIQMASLKYLDLEASEFTDEMAAILVSNKNIKKLDVGATKLTRKGLGHLSRMSQLLSLDIWAVDIVEEDLDLLSKMSNLEYLSIGGSDGQKKLTFRGVFPRLKALPSLKRIWLDGIVLTKSERKILEEHYEYVRN